VRASDFFIEDDDDSIWTDNAVETSPRLNEQLINSLRRGPLETSSDVSAALGLLDLVHEELEAYGTAGNHVLTDPQIALASPQGARSGHRTSRRSATCPVPGLHPVPLVLASKRGVRLLAGSTQHP